MSAGEHLDSALNDLRIDPDDREQESNKKFYYIVFLLLLISIIVILSFISIQKGTAKVSVVKAQVVDSSQGYAVLNASGYVTPRRRATIAAKITGRLTELYVEEGMRVKENQVLAKLDDTDAQARLLTTKTDLEVARAATEDIKVNLDNARRNLQRFQDLYSTGVVSEQQLDDSQRLVDSLTAQLDMARKQVAASQARLAATQTDLLNYTIIAPFAGIVVSKDAQIGEIVSPVSAGGGFTRTGIATIVDMESLEIEVDVNESYIAQVTVGQEVTAVLDAYPEWKIPARVRTIIPTADRQKATVKVRISFVELDPRILPDMGVKVTFIGQIESSTQKQDIVLVPIEAVVTKNNKTVIYVLKYGNVNEVAVTIGNTRGNMLEVIAGITPNDEIIIGDLSNLSDGQRARTKN